MDLVLVSFGSLAMVSIGLPADGSWDGRKDWESFPSCELYEICRVEVGENHPSSKEQE